MALFLLVLFVAAIVAQPASVVLAVSTEDDNLIRAVERDDKGRPINMDEAPLPSNAKNPKYDTNQKDQDFGRPSGRSATVADAKAATDARGNGDFSFLAKPTPYSSEPLGSDASQNSVQERELLEKRTARSTTSVNKKGEITEKHFFGPQFYKQDGQWKDIDTRLTEDKNAGDAGTVFGQAFGQVQSWFSSSTNFMVNGNDWNARFSPSGFERGMVRIKQGNSQIGFKPVNAKDVAPVITEEDGVQVVHYYDLWPGVNVEYLVTSDSVKENIILKDKASASSVSFEIIGATLEEIAAEGSTLPILKIKGALNDEFSIAAPNLILNNYGMVTDKPVLSQAYSNGRLTVSVDAEYLAGLPDNAFPAVIDPSTFKSAFGTREGGKYVSLKSDGYVCPSTTCNPYAGTLYDSSNILRDWRSAVYAPYDQFKVSGNNLINATLHLKQRMSSSFWTGTTATHTYYVGHAICTNNYNGCVEGNAWNASGNVGTSGDIDVTGIYATMISRQDWGAWLMLGYQGSSTSSFKNFDPGTSTSQPDGSYVQFTYGGPPPAPSVTKPVVDQVYVTTQPSFSVAGMANPNGSTPLKYQFMISTAEGATGALVMSPLLSSTQWTAPDNVLQDGGTYYLQVLSYDPITGTSSNWGTAVPFRVDMRTGKDKTQTYDELGPVAVDLATGNMTTSVTSHSSTALGGSLGVSLTYNSPLRSREGLVGRYWDNSTQSGNPSLTRVDQMIDFDWGLGNPGITNNDNYSARWDGYFVAPQTGTYYFGGNNDDSLVIKVNNQQLYSNGGCYTGICYGSSISLTTGQVVSFRADYVEGTSPAYAHLYVKTPDGIDQVAPSSWLQTGVRAADQERGMTGYYYRDDGTHSFTASGNYMFMKRTDPIVNFDWKSGSPVAGGLKDGFLARWTGYFTPPTTGNYYFGGAGDDGYRIIVDGNTILNKWTDGVHAKAYSSAVSLTANQSKLITIEYYEKTSSANFAFWVKGATASILPEQLMPAALMSPRTKVLPEGWNLGLDVSGSVAYEFLRQTQNSAILTDASGSTHEYKSTGTGYKPPVNEDGRLIRNDDGTFTLQDVNGRTYVFGTDGFLTSVTSSMDDRNPAALQYQYGSISGGPTHLYQIKDGVDPSRNMTLYYSGQSQCATPPGTYDAAPPANMLCAAVTNDGRTTNFFYKDKQLAYVEGPGGVDNTFEYEVVNDINSQPVGYRITKIRDALANDAVGAGVRTDNDTTKTLIAYDTIGRVISVKQPAALSGGSQLEHTIAYLPGKEAYEDSNGELVEGYYGATEQHVVGASEPEGYSQRIQYDALFRTIRAFDNTANSATYQYDNDKDLLLSTANSLDLKSTTIYDDEDRPVHSYGPAPRAWFGDDRVPLSQYLDQVPHSTVAYDQNIVGPAVAWHDYTKQTGNTNGVLSGAPKLHTTGINTATPGVLNNAFNSPPITAGSGAQGIGFSATGKLRLPDQAYVVQANTSDGIRIWVDDQLILDSWQDGAYRNIPGTASFTVTNNAVKRLRIDAYRKTGSTGAFSVLFRMFNGLTYYWTGDMTNYLKPDYSAVTGSTTYDNDLGDVTTATNYGSNPELGLPQSASVDPSGLNLIATSTYEAQGASGSFLRRTAKNLPGNPGTNPAFAYTYYGATETRDNPCTAPTEAFKQAGFLKIKTEASPDGGTTPGRSMEFIYDDSGNVVALRYNAESWTCTDYDSRGRVTHTHIQAYGSQGDRDVYNVWAMNGNPLQTASYDTNGWIIATVDLLGRTTSYTDTYGDWTGYEYNSVGLLTRKYGDMGEEVFSYDSYHRLATQVFNGTTYATLTYDTYGRVDHVDYNNAGQMRLTNSFNAFGRANQRTYRLGDGTTVVTDTAEFSQSGRIIGAAVQSSSNSLASDYTYDAAGRLTAATIGSNTYSYGFGAQDSSCGAGSNMNTNSGKNSNRTSQTINGVTTTYCYDYADRLVSSSDATANSPTYDSRGNTTAIGTGTKPLNLCYDSSNRNWCLTQYDSSGNGQANYSSRDVIGRTIYREQNTVTNWTWNLADQQWYGFTGGGDSPDFTRNAAWTITEQYLNLPGGVLLSLKPQQTGNNQKQYSLSSIQGHTLLTTDATGTNTSGGNGPASTFTYDPFGNPLPGSVLPANTTSGSYGFAGSNQKLTETTLDLKPIQMGARVYLSTLGRFTSPDPIDGGTPNRYVYVVDPINGSDYSGLLSVISSNSNFVITGVIYNYGMQPHAATPSPAANTQLQPTLSTAKTQGSASLRSGVGTIAAPLKVQELTIKKIGSAVVGGAQSVGGGIGAGVSWLGAGAQSAYQGNRAHIEAGLVGCGVGVAGSAAFTYVTAGGGQFELSAFSIASGCLIGGTSAVVKSVAPETSSGVDAVNQLKDAFDIYWYFLGR